MHSTDHSTDFPIPDDLQETLYLNDEYVVS
jgi:hypothetical protein